MPYMAGASADRPKQSPKDLSFCEAVAMRAALLRPPWAIERRSAASTTIVCRQRIGDGEKYLARGGGFDYFSAAHIRTCLWPRADRWTSGQEAGQSPGIRG
jgi:hypothetical protein